METTAATDTNLTSVYDDDLGDFNVPWTEFFSNYTSYWYNHYQNWQPANTNFSVPWWYFASAYSLSADSVLSVYQITLEVAITGLVSLFGIITNTINLVVFFRQGILSDTCTPCLGGLALSDLFCCLFMTWSSACVAILLFVNNAHFKWKVADFCINLGFDPKFTFTQITCCITAFLAFERFVSVVFPFKVTAIFNPRRSCLITGCIFFLVLILHVPLLISDLPSWEYKTHFNHHTLEFTEFIPYDNSYLITYSFLDNTLFRGLAVLILVICNVGIFWKVSLSQRFRKTSSTTSSVQNPKSSDKGIDKKPTPTTNNDKKELVLLRTITAISVMFFVCYFPSVVNKILMEVRNLYKGGKSHEIVTTMCSVLESINSSCNIIIYYTLSARYRQELKVIFCVKRG